MKHKVVLKKSLIGSTKKQKASAHCLRLKKPGQSVVLKMDAIRQGQINKIKHLILISPLSSKEKEKEQAKEQKQAKARSINQSEVNK